MPTHHVERERERDTQTNYSWHPLISGFLNFLYPDLLIDYARVEIIIGNILDGIIKYVIGL
jgi:hypothetical protein